MSIPLKRCEHSIYGGKTGRTCGVCYGRWEVSYMPPKECKEYVRPGVYSSYTGLMYALGAGLILWIITIASCVVVLG